MSIGTRPGWSTKSATKRSGRHPKHCSCPIHHRAAPVPRLVVYPSLRRRLAFLLCLTPSTPGEELEYLRVDTGGRLFVPAGCLATGGSPWLHTEGTPP